MSDDGLEQERSEVYALLSQLVSAPEVGDCDYRSALTRLLETARASERKRGPFMLLPLVMSQAIAGTAEPAVPAAAAWRALHIATKLLDDVEDGDVARMSDDAMHAAQVINLSTGFIAVVWLALARLEAAAANDLSRVFSATLLRMVAGQHVDLSRRATTNVDEYLEVMAAKSGAFFGLAAYAGARCVSTDSARLAACAAFGQSAGMLIQIVDDLEGIRAPIGQSDLATGQRTLPILYALEVASPEQRSELDEALLRAPSDAEAEALARQLLRTLGCETYLLAEYARYRHRASESLDHAAGDRGEALRGWFAALPSAMR